MTGQPATFILTAELCDASFDWLDRLRRQHFPPKRNYLDAHLTLFHRLDAQAIALVEQNVRSQGAAPIALQFTGLRKLGRGVAVTVEAPRLAALRSQLAGVLDGRLTRQDNQSFRPHVTIQNKADPARADALHALLSAGFVARTGETRALQVWEYLGGPWRFVARLPLCDQRPII